MMKKICLVAAVLSLAAFSVSAQIPAQAAAQTLRVPPGLLRPPTNTNAHAHRPPNGDVEPPTETTFCTTLIGSCTFESNYQEDFNFNYTPPLLEDTSALEFPQLVGWANPQTRTNTPVTFTAVVSKEGAVIVNLRLSVPDFRGGGSDYWVGIGVNGADPTRDSMGFVAASNIPACPVSPAPPAGCTKGISDFNDVFLISGLPRGLNTFRLLFFTTDTPNPEKQGLVGYQFITTLVQPY